MTPVDPRDALAALASEAGQSLASLSVRLGRNAAYLQQYLRRGSPRILPEADRHALARIFNVDEAELGGPAREADVAVPLLDINVAAGAGGVAEVDRVAGAIPVGAALLRELGVAPAQARFVRAIGGSMAPTIRAGDRLLVDQGDRGLDAVSRLRGDVFVVRVDGGLRVKRAVRIGARIELRSDADDVATTVHAAGEVAVLGRVRLLLRDAL